MELFLKGIQFGLVLCLLIGPIFFALVQTGVEQGLRAGLMVGLGVWLSDGLYALGTFWGLSFAERALNQGSFSVALGLAGSLILVAFGLGAWLHPPAPGPPGRRGAYRSSSYFSLWLKGFLINAVNPFTLFFWLGVTSTMVVGADLAGPAAALFFAGILGTVAVTDGLKVLLARRIRRWLRPVHLLWLRRISGSALIFFGLVLLVRVMLW